MKTKIIATLVTLGLIAQAELALACGGCVYPGGDGEKQTVVQNAERVLFLRDNKTKKSTVWIEVNYSGAAKDFGWVVPVPKLPVVGVGSRSVFDVLDARMGFRIASRMDAAENCRDPYAGCVQGQRAYPMEAGAFAADASAPSADAKASDTGASGASIEILAHGSTGPYNYVVIKGNEASKLYDWLTQNGYTMPEEAKPIIETHVKKGDLFLAIKLQNGQGINAIRPVTLQMDDAEPCVPLRLTSIAAADDMAVTVTVVGDSRAVVKNHLDVQLNPLRMTLQQVGYYNYGNRGGGVPDYYKSYYPCPVGAPKDALCQLPQNYAQVMAAAIDEAGGHAFVTESSLQGSAIGSIAPIAAEQLTGLKKAVTLLNFAEFLASSQLTVDAEFADTVDSLMSTYDIFKNQTSYQAIATLKACGQLWHNGFDGACMLQSGSLDKGTLKALKFDGTQAAALLQKSLVDPVVDVNAAIAAAGRVTRLVMRISPDEMDRDPIFAFAPSLPEVKPFITVSSHQVCMDGWQNGVQKTRVTVENMGSWLVDSVGIIDPIFQPLPAARATFVQEESGIPLQIAKADIGVVDMAIAGALPGKASLSATLVLQKATQLSLPPQDPTVKTLGPWHNPATYWCTPKPGWQDGKLPSTDQIPLVDGGSNDFDGGATEVSGARAPGLPSSDGNSNSGCTAGTSAAGSSGWLALFGVVGLLWMRRPTQQIAPKGASR